MFDPLIELVGATLPFAEAGKTKMDDPRIAASLDLLRGAVLVHTRYWWQMRVATDRGRLGVRHPLFVIRVRLAVALWLCVVTAVLCSRGDWWGLALLIFVAIHLLLAGRIAVRYRDG